MKWSDIVYIVLIAGLGIFAFKDCGKAKNCPSASELKCPNYDSLLAVVDSISKLPADTVIQTVVVSKVVVKKIVHTDTLQLNPPIVTYVTVNDSSFRAFVVDTITVQGELLEHRQQITFLDELNVIYEPVPQIVEVHDTLTIAKQVIVPMPEKWSVSAGGNLTYVNGKLYPAPMIEGKFGKVSISVAKPLDNGTSFIIQAGYRLFGK